MRVRPAELATGDEELRRAREELRRRQRQHLAEGSNWKRIDLDALAFGCHGVTDARTGERYRVYRGEVFDAVNVPVVAWFIRDGQAEFLEPR
jgi:hypothetical protein